MNKLEGLPTIHYISLEESVERRTNLENWFKKYNITDYVPHLFKRFEKYDVFVSLNLYSSLTLTLHFIQERRGHWAVYYSSTESFIIMFSYSLAY